MENLVKNNLRNFLVISLVFLIVTGWIFSGWPQIWQNPAIPPEIQEAQAATVTVYATSNSVKRSISIDTSLTVDRWFQTTGNQFGTDILTDTVTTTDGG